MGGGACIKRKGKGQVEREEENESSIPKTRRKDYFEEKVGKYSETPEESVLANLLWKSVGSVRL